MFLYIWITTFCVITRAQNEGPNYWLANGQAAVERALLENQPNMGMAKNIILLVGDGMGVSTTTAARILKGQLQGRSGEGDELSFEKMPYSGLIKPYSVDFQTPDSAAAATAFLAGVKTNNGVIGLDARVRRGNCSVQAMNAAKVQSLLQMSANNGKSTGIVTNTRVTHATPAAGYAHTAERGWEDDTSTPPACTDIAVQLIEQNPYIEVVLGGGRRHFEPVSNNVYATSNPGRRQDRRNLINEWKADKQMRGQKSEFVENRSQLSYVDPLQTDYLLGLFSSSHMKYEMDKTPDSQEPTLSEMTEKAMEILQRNYNGYFLLVEGGRIDHAHHRSNAARALHEVLEFDRAAETALRMANLSETLVIVTADHSHTLVVSGYPKRGNPVLGVAGIESIGADGLPYTTLLYGNGPGYRSGNKRRNLYGVNTAHKDFVQASAVPLRTETHSAEDVAVYAQGPMAHLLSGVHEQSYIAHVMMYASCVGLNKYHCAIGNSQNTQNNAVISNRTKSTNSANTNIQNRHLNKIVHTEQLALKSNSTSIRVIFLYFPAVLAISLAVIFAILHTGG